MFAFQVWCPNILDPYSRPDYLFNPTGGNHDVNVGNIGGQNTET